MTDNTKIADAIETTIYNSLLAAIKGSAADGATGGAADYIWDYFNPLNGTHNNNGGGCIAGDVYKRQTYTGNYRGLFIGTKERWNTGVLVWITQFYQ